MKNKALEIIFFITRMDKEFQDKMCELEWMKEEKERNKDEEKFTTVEIAEIQMRKQMLAQTLDKFKNKIEEVF